MTTHFHDDQWPDLEHRLLSKIESSGPCWEWTASTIRGYGQFTMIVDGKKRNIRITRFIAEKMLGRPLGDGEHVCHRCDNPACVRPSHLFVGSAADNMRDMRAKGRSNSGERNGMSRLTGPLAVWCREAFRMGVPKSVIAGAVGVSESAVGHVVSGRSWSNTPGSFVEMAGQEVGV